MALPITTEEAEQLAREIAHRTEETPEQAVTTSLQERLARLRLRDHNDRDIDQFVASIMAISEHCASLPVLDSRTPDEMLGYDERGLPN